LRVIEFAFLVAFVAGVLLANFLIAAVFNGSAAGRRRVDLVSERPVITLSEPK
jgi:hypothetical protein